MDKSVEQIVKLYSNSKTYYRPRMDDYVKYYKQYRSWLDQDSMRDYYKWRSRLFIPATARAVDGLLPDLMLTLFGTNPFFEIKPRESEDVIQASINQGILEYEFEIDQWIFKNFVFLKQMAIYGTSFGKVYWKKDSLEESVEVDDIILGKQKINREVTMFDSPCFTPIDIFALYYSPKATSLKDTWIIQRSEKSLGEIKRQGVYQNVSELENYIMSEVDTDRYEIEIRKYQQGLPAAYSGDEGDDRKIELLEFWNSDRTKTMTVAGQAIMVRPMRDNPLGVGFDPFVMASLWPNPFEFTGVGVPEKVRDIQDQLNSEVNQRLDNRNIRQNLVIKVRRGANVNVRNLISRPAAIWLTDDMAAIEPITFPDISSSTSFAEENMLEGKCEEITGVTKYVTGGGTDSRRTATESSILQRMGSKQFALHVALLEDMYVKPVIRKFHTLNQKFLTKDQVVRIVGNKGQLWMPSSYQDAIREYDIVTSTASSLVDKNLKAQQMTNYLQIIAQDPTMQAMRHQLHKKIWETWGYKDFDALNMPETPAAPPSPIAGLSLPPQIPGGIPVEPTGLREPSPMEGNAPMMMGGGGSQVGGY